MQPGSSLIFLFSTILLAHYFWYNVPKAKILFPNSHFMNASNFVFCHIQLIPCLSINNHPGFSKTMVKGYFTDIVLILLIFSPEFCILFVMMYRQNEVRSLKLRIFPLSRFHLALVQLLYSCTNHT